MSRELLAWRALGESPEAVRAELDRLREELRLANTPASPKETAEINAAIARPTALQALEQGRSARGGGGAVKGNNELNLNQLTMIEAIQEYLAKRWTGPTLTVLSVKADRESTTYGCMDSFIIKIEAQEPTP
jgi:hypothetical protein